MLAKTGCRTKLCPFSLGIALGVTQGLLLFFLACAGHLWHYGITIIHLLASVYSGYAPTIAGGGYGALWGFLDGFVFGFILALIYDCCLCCCCAKTSSCEPKDLHR